MSNKNALKLFKIIKKLHRSIPADIRLLGDNYVRDEFKRHKCLDMNKDQQIIKIFMWEWTQYAINLADQLGVKSIQEEKKIGNDLTEDQLNKFFNDEQISQLHELYLAATEKEKSY